MTLELVSLMPEDKDNNNLSLIKAIKLSCGLLYGALWNIHFMPCIKA